MAPMTRTDVHSPSNMDPADYIFRFAIDNREGGWARTDYLVELSRRLAEGDRLGRGTHQCHHCGARIRYAALMEHIPTGEIIAIGETCLDNRFALESKAQFDRLRQAAALDRKAQRIKTAARDFLSQLPDAVAHALARETDLSDLNLTPWPFDTITDIRNSLWKWGSLSEKQVALVERLLAEAPARAAELEARAAEVKVPAPVGKATVTGTVIKRVYKENNYSYYGQGSWKITLKCKTPDGVFFAWVTEPKAIESKRGDVVTLTATWTHSDDPSFAFGKRPSKAEIIGTEAEIASAPSALD